LAVFGNDAGTASTDANGAAIIQILVGANSGAGEIVATLSSGEESTTTFNSTGNSGGSRSIQLALTDQLNGEVSAELSPTSPLKLTAIVSDSNGGPVTGSVISYTFEPEGLAVFGNDSATARTGTDGEAIIDILVGENSGAGQITATLSSGETAIATFNSAGNSGGGGSRSIQLLLTDQLNGEASAELSPTSPLRLTAIVSNSNGQPVTSTLITYTFQPDGLAIFGNDSGTASTDANGVAIIEILAGENSGAGQITATLSSGETAITTFNSAGNGVSRSIQLALTAQLNGEASAELSLTSPLRLTAIVSNSSGEPVTSTLITYTFQPDGLAIFGNDSGTASTDANGVATIEILVGENSGAGQILATLGSGETATTTFNSAGTTLVGEQPASLDLFGSSTQLASSGSDEIELIALVKDVNNVLLEGIDVTFSVNSEATIQLENSGNVAVTGADGIARAFLNTQNKPENRTITVTATASGLADPKTLDVIVVGTGISVNTPPSVILGSEAELTIFLSDSDGKGIANKTVQINSENGNLFYNFDSPPKLVTELVTDGEGQATVTYSANNSGIDVITATGLNAEGVPVNISVQQDQFSFNIVTSDDINLGELSTLGLTWLKENSPLSNGGITLTTTRGTLNTSSVTTDADGKASFQISSANAGRAVVSAQGKDINGNIVNARADVEFIAINVDNIILSASPNSIGPSGQKSTVTAVLRDAAGNLVKGKTVNFNADDVSGGEISPASAVTDSNGLASTVYTSLNVTKENGITIIAKEPDSGVDAVVNLTVANRAQFISIGTGNLIESPDETSYLKKFTVFVTDANSNPVSNVELTVTGTPVKYTELLEPNAEDGDPNYQVIRPAFYKGFWSAFPSIEDFEYWVAVRTIGCANEDVDSDGIEDPNENTNGDDGLTPVNIVSIDGNVVTDENGQAIIELRYAKTYAAWGEIKITASTPVSGSESQASQFFTLSASAADLSLDTTPPNNNPFGTGVNRVEDANNPGTFTDDGANLTCSNAL
jgi:hypothetical protein